MDNNFAEPVFGQDDFRKPKVLKGYEAVIQSILVVLFGKPGCFPSIPELGMNIQQYRNMREDAIDVDALKAQLAYQCKSIAEGIIDGEIDVRKTTIDGNLALLFIIPIEDTTENAMLIGVQMKSDGITYNYDLMEATSSH